MEDERSVRLITCDAIECVECFKITHYPRDMADLVRLNITIE